MFSMVRLAVLFVPLVAHQEDASNDALHLLQKIAKKHNTSNLDNSWQHPWSSLPKLNPAGRCTVTSQRVHTVLRHPALGVDGFSDRSRGDVITAGLHTLMASKDGNIVIQGMYCWRYEDKEASGGQGLHGVGHEQRLKGVALKIGDTYISFLPVDWDEAFSKESIRINGNLFPHKYLQWGRLGTWGIAIGQGVEPKRFTDLTFVALKDGDGIQHQRGSKSVVDDKLGSVEMSAVPEAYQTLGSVWIRHKPSNFYMSVAIQPEDFSVTINFKDADQINADDYFICNMNVKSNPAWRMHFGLPGMELFQKEDLWRHAVKHAKMRSGCTNWKMKDNVSTTCYEANLFDAITAGTNGKYCDYCPWKSKFKHESAFNNVVGKKGQTCAAWTHGSMGSSADMDLPDVAECNKTTPDVLEGHRTVVKELRQQLKSARKQLQETEEITSNCE